MAGVGLIGGGLAADGLPFGHAPRLTVPAPLTRARNR